jgi:hypothetical protein
MFFAYLDSPRPVTASAKLIASPFENGDEVDESGNKIFKREYKLVFNYQMKLDVVKKFLQSTKMKFQSPISQPPDQSLQ